ncbi:MAG: ComEC/Rec2 family competence protein [Pseudomonadota bacterium]
MSFWQIDIRKIVADLSASRQFLPIWAILCFIGGIAFFLIRPNGELSASWFIIAGLGALVLWFVASKLARHDPKLKFWLAALPVCFMLGLGRIALLSEQIAGSPPPYPIYGVHDFKGLIIGEHYASKRRYLLFQPEQSDSYRFSDHRWHLRIRISHDHAVTIGQLIALRAYVRPPPDPVWPGGYDSQKRAFFTGLAGYGHAIGPPEVIVAPRGPPGLLTRARLFVEKLRSDLHQRLKSRLEAVPASFASALLIGFRGDIDRNLLNALRAAGMMHLLAISGLHMGIVMGGSFFFSRAVMAACPNLMRAYPIKKIAALIALLAGLFYLLLTGATVPTKRAFTMGLVGVCAILCDRNVISLRLVAFAAFLVALINPWTVVGASFLLSFTAVTALVAWFEWYRTRRAQRTTNHRGRIRRFIWQIIWASLIAGLATQPLTALIFGYGSPWGILTNMIAVPLASFVMMPALFIMLVPGFDLVAEPVFVWSLSIILELAERVYHWPGGVVRLGQLESWPVLGFMLFGIIAVISIGRIRAFGLVLMVASYLLVFVSPEPRPDLVVGPLGKRVAVRIGEDSWVINGSTRSGFLHDIWQGKLKLAGFESVRQQFDCPKTHCIIESVIESKRYRIGWFGVAEHLPPNLQCEAFDVVILAARIKPVDFCRPGSDTVILQRDDFYRAGSHLLFLAKGEGGLTEIISDRMIRGDHPWVGWQFAFAKR